jgi:hypothetical protein
MSITINAENVVQMKCQEEGCKCVPIASRGLPVSIKIAIENSIENGSSYVVLPVFEIQGIKVNCQLIVNENGMSLRVDTNKILTYRANVENLSTLIIRQLLFRKTYIKKFTKYTLKDYESVIKHINDDINNMKFDILNGVLFTSEIKHPRNAPHIISHTELINSSVPCDENQADDCCVCLEVTKTTTPCGHKLCVACWCQVKLNEDELHCPICRTDLYHNGNHDNEDDDDDDDDSMDSSNYYGSETYEEHRWSAFRSR